MSLDRTNLPKDHKALAHIIERHGDRCDAAFVHRRTNWMLAWYYLNGYRRFDVYDPGTGALTPHLLDEEGNMEYQAQDLLFQINQVAGRLQSMDCRAQVMNQGYSLAAQRDRSLAQIITDSTMTDDQIRRIQEEYSWLFTCLGCAGLVGHVVDHPTIGLCSDIEVIHPRELAPWPLVGQDMSKAQGLMRSRWVSIDYLEEVYGKRKIRANLDDIEWFEIEPGEEQHSLNDVNELYTRTGHRSGSRGIAESLSRGETTKVALIRELWTTGIQNTVNRYVCCSGDFIAQDQDLSSLEVYCPIGFARFMNNGTWHGAGMFDLLYSVHRKMEMLSKNLFNNVLDIDRYGVLVLPQGQFNQNSVLRDVGRGLRTIFWEPDPTAEGFNPFAIQPFNSGDMPGRTAQFARDSMKAVNPISDIIQEKGRVDSASGLQMLEEQVTRALTTPTLGVVKCFGDMYKSLCQKAASKMTASPRALPLGNLTLDLAGAVINPKTFEVSFPENPLPRISGLSFTVRSISPKSTVARKQEALQLWRDKLETDPMAFKLFALKEGLDFAMWTDEIRGSYEMGIRALLIAFGDGETPGQIILTPYTTNPEIVLRLLNGFVTSPVMQMASPPVFKQMKKFRETLINYMGMVLPNAIPNPDDAAMLQGMGDPMMSGMAPGGPPMLGAAPPMM